ncbi:hypothetical protein BGZ60DRAFT_134879 [Tricladium varicosporioides]|nr:hypothetical protein BGZ60DRAFT_134879 [Hymenoscyphus varicosporioides]
MALPTLEGWLMLLAFPSLCLYLGTAYWALSKILSLRSRSLGFLTLRRICMNEDEIGNRRCQFYHRSRQKSKFQK